jgi:hypothetical protein
MAFPFSTHNDLGGATLRSSYTMQSPRVGAFTLRELGKSQVGNPSDIVMEGNSLLLKPFTILKSSCYLQEGVFFRKFMVWG